MWKEKLKKRIKVIIETKSSPDSIAAGFAVGTFIGIFPTPGVSVLLGLIALFIFPKLNKYALFIAIAFWNPIIQSPLYFLSYRIGNWIFGSEEVIRFQVHILNEAYNFTRMYLVGNIILATSISLLSYFLIRYFASRHQMKRKLRTSRAYGNKSASRR